MNELDQVAAAAQAVRDAPANYARAVRAAHQAGHSVIEIAQAAGVTRGAVYLTLHKNDEITVQPVPIDE